MGNTSYLFPEFDFEKSISKGRVVYRLTFGMVVNYIMNYFMAFFVFSALSLIIGATIPTIDDAKNDLAPIIVIAVPVALNILIVMNFVFLNKMVFVSGDDPELNEEIIVKLLKDSYRYIDARDVRENVIRYITSSDLGPKRRITVLFSENDFYINIITLGKNDSQFPLATGYFDYLKSKRIAREFLKKIAIAI